MLVAVTRTRAGGSSQMLQPFSNARHLFPRPRLSSSHAPTSLPSIPHLRRDSPASAIASAVQNDGYAVIRSLFTPSQMHALNTDLSPILSLATPGQPAATVRDSTIPDDPAVRAAIFGSATKRIDKLIMHSPTWRAMADDTTFHGICEKIFAATGDYWLSTAQMIEIGPGSAAGPLHPDAGLWSLLLGLDDARAPEVAVNFLVAASRTTVANGATGVVEGSQRLPMGATLRDPGAGVWRTPDGEVKQVELEVGDCLLVGGKIWHRGGANGTEGEKRRVLSVMVTSCALTPEEAHPFYVDGETAAGLGERARKFFGFQGLRPAVGAGFWRQ